MLLLYHVGTVYEYFLLFYTPRFSFATVFFLPSSHLISCCFHVAFALALALAAVAAAADASADASVSATALHFCYCFRKLRLIFVCVNVCVLF